MGGSWESLAAGSVSPHCPVCGGSNLGETTWHLIVDCSFVVRYCKESGLWAKLDAMCYEVDNHTDFFMRALCNFASKEAMRMIGVAWAIWRHRNQVVWEGKHSTPVQVVFAATSFMEEWQGWVLLWVRRAVVVSSGILPRNRT